jgi:hypothetical protein
MMSPCCCLANHLRLLLLLRTAVVAVAVLCVRADLIACSCCLYGTRDVASAFRL